MQTFSWRGSPRLTWFTAVAILLALDQLSKAWFANAIALGTAFNPANVLIVLAATAGGPP